MHENLHSSFFIMYLNVATDNLYQKIVQVKIVIIFLACILLDKHSSIICDRI